MRKTTIEKVAHRARNQFEGGTVAHDLLVSLYREYSRVGDTSGFVKKANDIFPTGNCGLASLYLKRELGGEVVQGKYEDNNHTFLLIDNMVVDITADQFGGPKIYVGYLRSPWSLRDK
jgi:hypothetical protein